MAGQKNGMNPLIAAAIGAAAGAAVVTLADKNKREKIKKTFSEQKEMGEQKMKEVKGKGKKKVINALERAKAKLEEG